MAKKREQPKNLEIGRRVRSQARMLTGRLFIANSHPLLVRGTPTLKQLLDCADRRPEHPQDIGFSPSDIVPVTDDLLSTIHRALQKWRKIIEDQSGQRKQNSATRAKIRHERNEIVGLLQTLNRVGYVSRECSSGCAHSDTPFVLLESTDASALSHLRSRVAEWRGIADQLHDKDVTMLLEIVHLVTWLSGAVATTRFVDSVDRYLTNTPAQSAVANSDRVVPLNSLTAKRLVRLAMLFAVDGATCLYPPSVLAKLVSMSLSDLSVLLLKLSQCAQNDCDSYCAVLATIEQLEADVWMSGRDLGTIQNLLRNQNDASDLEWVFQHRLGHVFDETKTLIAPVRKCIDQLQHMGLLLSETQMREGVQLILERRTGFVFSPLNDWLRHLSRHARTPRLAKALWASLVALARLLPPDRSYGSVLNQWAMPPSKLPPVTDAPCMLSPDVDRSLRLIGHYRRMAGVTQRPIPQSLWSELFRNQQINRELAYLEAAETRGELSRGMATRLEHLRRRPESATTSSEGKLKRQIDKACANAAIEALRQRAALAAVRHWERVVGHRAPEGVERAYLVDICTWLGQLPKSSRTLVEQLLSSYATQGGNYKESMPSNQKWLADASRAGVSIAHWLYPPEASLALDGQKVTILLARHPFDVLLMGSFFDTCLALYDDWNRDSVLANACDANRAVVFVYGPGGQVWGRKLVALSTRLEMIGYHTYVAKDGDARQRLVNLMEWFCGRWAAKANVSFANLGTPQTLHPIFWYDDGTVPWSPIAREALESAQASFEEVEELLSQRPLLSERVVTAVERYRRDCESVLAECIGADRVADMTPPWHARPELVEELLAIVARRLHNIDLAEMIHEEANSEGARREAITSLAIMRGPCFDEAFVATARRDRELSERVGRVLYDRNTPASTSVLIDLVLRGTVCGLWLPIIAARSDHDAQQIVNALSQRQRWWIAPHVVTASLMLCEHHLGQLPDGVYSNLAGMSDRIDPQDLSFGSLVFNLDWTCWLPQLKNANKVLTDRYFKRLVSRRDLADDEFEHPGARAHLNVLCMKHPCTSTRRVLHERAGESPDCLLAFALCAKGHQRHKSIVLRHAPKWTKSAAALLALRHVVGVEAVHNALSTCHRTKGRDRELALSVDAMYNRWSKDETIESSQIPRHGGLEWETSYPILFQWFWKVLEQIGQGGNPPSAQDMSDRLAEADRVSRWFPWSSIAFRIALEARRSDEDRERSIKHFLRQVTFEPDRDRSRIGPLVDFVSGGALFDGGPIAKVWRHHDYHEYGYSGALPLMLFDQDGRPCPVANEGWDDIDWYGYVHDIPPDPSEARRYLEWVWNQDTKRGRKWVDKRMEELNLTELQKLILRTLCSGGVSHQ